MPGAAGVWHLLLPAGHRPWSLPTQCQPGCHQHVPHRRQQGQTAAACGAVAHQATAAAVAALSTGDQRQRQRHCCCLCRPRCYLRHLRTTRQRQLQPLLLHTRAHRCHVRPAGRPASRQTDGQPNRQMGSDVAIPGTGRGALSWSSSSASRR
jgi:hypothetical protein